MGTWNTSIMGNDTSAEVSKYFSRMYNYQEGGEFKWSLEQIADSLYTYYYNTMEDLPSEKCNVLFALAQCMWQKDKLSGQLKKAVTQLVHQKIDYNAWKELEADEKTLKSRWLATTKFIEQLDTKYDKVKTRSLQPKKISAYTVGDCLAFKYNEYFYGIIVLNDGRNVDDGSNELAFVDIKSKSLPKLKDFRQSNIILNEDLINHFSGNTTTIDPSNVLYVIKLGKGAFKGFHKYSELIGRLPLTRTFFDSSGIRFDSYAVSHKSADLVIVDALSFWGQRTWKVADYKPEYDCTIPHNATIIKNGVLQFGDHKYKLKDLEVKVINSLWHVNIYFRIANKTAADIKKHWTYFAALFEQLTKREINLFSYASEATEGLQPFSTIDFTTFKLKHVNDSAII
ncbi:hypothetical protein [Ferruginibacter sp. SUN106]|uniref:hypothetical protein n=1 Tax=Ferruginibacter sp. SUN106 TaxID=2978348 RepID=UPI003D363ED6